MSWNFRVIRTDEKHGWRYYAIHECYYHERADLIPHSWTEAPVCVSAGTRQELFYVLSAMTEAVAKPVLKVVGNSLVEVEPHAN